MTRNLKGPGENVELSRESIPEQLKKEIIASLAGLEGGVGVKSALGELKSDIILAQIEEEMGSRLGGLGVDSVLALKEIENNLDSSS